MIGELNSSKYHNLEKKPGNNLFINWDIIIHWIISFNNCCNYYETIINVTR